eukprot:jgi/Bigna1/144583/aug1.89_g19291
MPPPFLVCFLVLSSLPVIRPAKISTRSYHRQVGAIDFVARWRRGLRGQGASRVLYPLSPRCSESEANAQKPAEEEARDIASALPPGEKEYLVSNKYNDVKVCVAGVSNAGKSSLINHLLKKDNIARASSVTGKTRSVDLFIVNDKFILVDLPGFPGADGQASKLWDEQFEPLVQVYLRDAEDLRGMLFAHDVRWPVTSDEVRYLTAAKQLNLPVLALLTKDDRVEHKQRNWGLSRFMQDTGFDGRHIHYCSDNKLPQCRKSRRMALRFIESVCGRK